MKTLVGCGGTPSVPVQAGLEFKASLFYLVSARLAIENLSRKKKKTQNPHTHSWSALSAGNRKGMSPVCWFLLFKARTRALSACSHMPTHIFFFGGGEQCLYMWPRLLSFPNAGITGTSNLNYTIISIAYEAGKKTRKAGQTWRSHTLRNPRIRGSPQTGA